MAALLAPSNCPKMPFMLIFIYNSSNIVRFLMIDTIITFLDSTSFVFYGWLIASLLCLLFELMMPGLFFFISFAAGCCGGAAAFLYDLPFTAQCASFLVLSGIVFIF